MRSRSGRRLSRIRRRRQREATRRHQGEPAKQDDLALDVHLGDDLDLHLRREPGLEDVLDPSRSLRLESPEHAGGLAGARRRPNARHQAGRIMDSDADPILDPRRVEPEAARLERPAPCLLGGRPKGGGRCAAPAEGRPGPEVTLGLRAMPGAPSALRGAEQEPARIVGNRKDEEHQRQHGCAGSIPTPARQAYAAPSHPLFP